MDISLAKLIVIEYLLTSLLLWLQSFIIPITWLSLSSVIGIIDDYGYKRWLWIVTNVPTQWVQPGVDIGYQNQSDIHENQKHYEVLLTVSIKL